MCKYLHVPDKFENEGGTTESLLFSFMSSSCIPRPLWDSIMHTEVDSKLSTSIFDTLLSSLSDHYHFEK
jgi:hypothetical protein